MTRASWYGLSDAALDEHGAGVAAVGARLDDRRVDRVAVGVAEVDDDLADEPRRAAALERRDQARTCDSGASSIGVLGGHFSGERDVRLHARTRVGGADGPSYRQPRGYPECLYRGLDDKRWPRAMSGTGAASRRHRACAGAGWPLRAVTGTAALRDWRPMRRLTLTTLAAALASLPARGACDGAARRWRRSRGEARRDDHDARRSPATAACSSTAAGCRSTSSPPTAARARAATARAHGPGP